MKRLTQKLVSIAVTIMCLFSLAQPAAAAESKTAYYSGYQMWGCSSRYYYNDGEYSGTLYKVAQSPIGDGVNYYCYYMGEVYKY
jgi:hypothetical protein